MVKSEVNSVVTYYAGRHYHKVMNGEEETIRKFYSTGSANIAVRTNDVLTWILSDHLGSASVTADESGVKLNETRYTTFGEVRQGFSSLGTSYEYTGQLSQMDEIGLYYYVARWFDPVTAHFGSADTIVPDPRNVKTYDRYSYSLNNPVNLSDPSGHRACEEEYCPGERFHPYTRHISQPTTISREILPTPVPYTAKVPSPEQPSFISPRAPQTIGPSTNTTSEDGLAQTLQNGWNAVQQITTIDDAFTFLVNHGRPTYKHVKGLGSILTPAGEGFIGGLLQAAQDSQNPDFSYLERLERALVVGAEDAITDVISSSTATFLATPGVLIGGGATIETGPGVVAGAGAGYFVLYVAVSYGTTILLDGVASNVNHIVAPRLFP